MTAVPGAVLVHGRFDCHLNFACYRRSIQILRVPWFNDSIEGHFRVRDPDLIVRLTERDPLEASAQLALDLRPALCRERHWTEELAAALSEETTLALKGWAAERGIRPDAISHGFHRVFGVSPKLFRLEVRSRPDARGAR